MRPTHQLYFQLLHETHFLRPYMFRPPVVIITGKLYVLSSVLNQSWCVEDNCTEYV